RVGDDTTVCQLDAGIAAATADRAGIGNRRGAAADVDAGRGRDDRAGCGVGDDTAGCQIDAYITPDQAGVGGGRTDATAVDCGGADRGDRAGCGVVEIAAASHGQGAGQGAGVDQRAEIGQGIAVGDHI